MAFSEGFHIPDYLTIAILVEVVSPAAMMRKPALVLRCNGEAWLELSLLSALIYWR